jgi:predicted RNase H-like nuclease
VARHARRAYEVHPDVSFVHANGGAHLPWSKSSWNGIHLRKRIFVSRATSLPDDLGVPGGAGCADVLDAAIAAWSADRIAGGKAVRLPEGSDRAGAIWS